MSFLKTLVFLAVALLLTVLVVTYTKEEPSQKSVSEKSELDKNGMEQISIVPEIARPEMEPLVAEQSITAPLIPEEEVAVTESESIQTIPEAEPVVDRIKDLFIRGEGQLPIVETITYTSHVPWMQGRRAWLADYASHYATSRHFIARSLHGGAPDYLNQKVAEGDRFNVFRQERPLEFHLVVDLSSCHLWFYYYDKTDNAHVLLKRYTVGLGRKDTKTASGYLTPLGTYTLGNKIMTYKPGEMGRFQQQPTEMVTVFGTRWLPFDKEISGCTAPSKGYGLHGVPWEHSKTTNELVEQQSCTGQYTSDGCIRLLTEDIEEIYAIVVTKPTFVHIVSTRDKAILPGEPK